MLEQETIAELDSRREQRAAVRKDNEEVLLQLISPESMQAMQKQQQWISSLDEGIAARQALIDMLTRNNGGLYPQGLHRFFF